MSSLKELYRVAAGAEEGTPTPSLPRTPSRLRRAPQRFCQSELECRHAHWLSVAVGCSVSDAWGALFLSIGKTRSLSSLSQSNSGPISRVYDPPTKHTD